MKITATIDGHELWQLEEEPVHRNAGITRLEICGMEIAGDPLPIVLGPGSELRIVVANEAAAQGRGRVTWRGLVTDLPEETP